MKNHCSVFIDDMTNIQTSIFKEKATADITIEHCLSSRSNSLAGMGRSKVHLRSVDPQKNCCNYLITHSILKFPTL